MTITPAIGIDLETTDSAISHSQSDDLFTLGERTDNELLTIGGEDYVPFLVDSDQEETLSRVM